MTDLPALLSVGGGFLAGLLGSGGISALLRARADRNKVQAESDRVAVDAANTVVELLREQLRSQERRIEVLERKVSDLRSERDKAHREVGRLRWRIAHLEQELRRAGIAVPTWEESMIVKEGL